MSKRSYELSEAVSRLVVKQPFFAVIMLDLLTLIETDSIPTAATDAKHLYVNPSWFNSKTLDERVFVLCHEVMHVILEHCQRNKLYIDRGVGPDMKRWSPSRWNQATDYIINSWLAEIGVGSMPVGGLHHPNFGKDDLADEVYLKVPDQEDDDNWDVHMPADDAAPSKADVQRAVKGGHAAAKAMGSTPAGMDRLVDDICEPQIKWGDRVKMAVTRTAGRDENTWARPNRRRLAAPPHVYWPGRTGHQAGHIVMYGDTSGSVSQLEWSHFFGEMAGLMDELHPETMQIGSCDTVATDPVTIEDASDVATYTPVGGGGTDMGAIIEKLAEHRIRPDCLVILTDGYTPWGTEPSYPVIWVITAKDIEAPYGESIHIEVTQQ